LQIHNTTDRYNNSEGFKTLTDVEEKKTKKTSRDAKKNHNARDKFLSSKNEYNSKVEINRINAEYAEKSYQKAQVTNTPLSNHSTLKLKSANLKTNT
jgi:hypothetical protein